MTELLILTSLILSWSSTPQRRLWLLISLLAVIASDIVTFTYHYPSNTILFQRPLSADTKYLERVAREWAVGNYVRVGLMITAISSAIRALLMHVVAG